MQVAKISPTSDAILRAGASVIGMNAPRVKHLLRILPPLISVSLICAMASLVVGETATTRVPILVELFTSEGCSDCPPADAFLQKLDEQPFPGAEMIVLSEHVDYWNHIGWKDPYSSPLYSQRQEAYGREFALGSVYTPQMVVDGTSEFVGSDRTAASKAFAQAISAPKIAIRLSSISIDPANILRVHLETDALENGHSADVYLAVARNHAVSQVSAGENAGRKLSHTAVVHVLSKAGSLQEHRTFAQEIQVKLPSDLPNNDLRLIAFVQQVHQGRILGATMQPVTPK